MKNKLFLFSLCCILVLLLASCGNIPTTNQTSSQNIQSSSELTKDDFLEKIGGIWIYIDTADCLWEGQYSCTFCSFGNNVVSTGTYPGGFGSSNILEYRQISENEFTLTLKDIPNDEGGDPNASPRINKYVLNNNESITVVDENGERYELVYGGTTFDEVNEKLKEIVK